MAVSVRYWSVVSVWVYGDMLTASPMICFIGPMSYVIQLLREYSQIETSRPLQSGGTAGILWSRSSRSFSGDPRLLG